MAGRSSIGYEIMGGLSGGDLSSLASSMFSGLSKAGGTSPSTEMQQVMLRIREEELAREQAAASRAGTIAWLTVGAGVLGGLAYALVRVLRR